MKTPSMNKASAVVALAISALASVPAAAQNLQAPPPPQPTPSRPSAVPATPATAPAASAPASGAVVTLQSVEVTGNTTIPTATLLSALGEVKGQRLDAAGLNALASRVTAYYRSAGYVFALAFLPPQDLRSGVLRISILEGRYGKLRAAAPQGLAEDAQAFVDFGLKSGDPIENTQLERTLLILDEQPGIRVRPVISPGARRGEGDLTVNVERGKRISGEVAVDNIGARSTGEHRLRGNLAINSPFMLGDKVTLGAMVTDEDMWLGSADYERPIGPSGLRGQLGYAHTSYQLGSQFAALDARGLAKITSARLSYPLVRSQARNLLGFASFSHKDLRDEYRASNVIQEKRSDATVVGLQFDARDALAGGGLTFGSLTYTIGRLKLDPTLAAADAVTARTRGNFDKMNLDLARIQQIAGPVSAYLRFSGQWTGENLDSSEKFNLGGYYGVRAYPLGEGVGDRGYLAQAELRYSFGAVTPYVFHDFGKSHANAKPWDANSAAQRKVAGSGIGVRSLLGAWSIDGTLAWRTEGGVSTTDGGRDRSPRLFFMAGRRF